MKTKLPWLRYDKAKRDYLAAKEEAKEAKKVQEKVAREFQATEAPLRLAAC